MRSWRAQGSAWSSKTADVVVGRVRLSASVWHVEFGVAICGRSGRHVGRNEEREVVGEKSYSRAMISFRNDPNDSKCASRRTARCK